MLIRPRFDLDSSRCFAFNGFGPKEQYCNASAYTDMFCPRMKELVSMAKVLSDPSRVRILVALRERELCVCELCTALAMTQSTLSTHLKVIRQAGLVSARKEGKWMYYRTAQTSERLLVQLFQSFSSSLKNDPVLSRDSKNLKDRLRLRSGNSCCIGFSGTNCK